MNNNDLHNERELLTRMSTGDQEAFAILFNIYKGPVYHIAWRLTGSATIGEEITQDVFLKIWVKREHMISVENFCGYLFTIARHITYRALKALAKERQNQLRSELVNHLFDPEVEQIMRQKDYDCLLKNAIDLLPPKQQQTFLLIRQDGLRREEAARQLNVSPETVKYNLEEAVRKVRAYCLAHSDISFIVLLLFAEIK